MSTLLVCMATISVPKNRNGEMYLKSSGRRAPVKRAVLARVPEVVPEEAQSAATLDYLASIECSAAAACRQL
jgi:hypothetical protein